MDHQSQEGSLDSHKLNWNQGSESKGALILGTVSLLLGVLLLPPVVLGLPPMLNWTHHCHPLSEEYLFFENISDVLFKCMHYLLISLSIKLKCTDSKINWY